MSILAALPLEPALLAGFAAMMLAFGYALVSAWRDGMRRKAGEEVRSSLAAMAETIALLWLLCAACLTAWLASGRTLDALGLGPGEGWRALIAWALGAGGAVWLLADTRRTLASGERREKLAAQMQAAGGLGYFDLRTPREAGVFQTMAVTAGLTEEIIFRGFALLTLTLVLPLWAAALVSAAIFILFHAYQGAAGMLRITPITVVLTALVMVGGTLWPAILVHIVVDMVGGMVLWGARAELAAQRGAVR